MMSGFGEIMYQAEEKWRADMLEQLYEIRRLLETIALRGSSELIDVQIESADCDVTENISL